MTKKFHLKNATLAIACFSYFVFFLPEVTQMTSEEVRSQSSSTIFEEKFRNWVEYIYENPNLSTYTVNKEFYEIVKLGIPALPFILEKMEKGYFHLEVAVSLITKKGFEKSNYVDPNKKGDAITKSRMYIQWWKEGRKETPQCFENLYTEWRTFKQTGKSKKASEVYKKILRLGIIILPYLTEKIADGDTDLIPAVSTLTDGEVKEDAKPEDCVKWWNKNKEKWYIPIEDEPIEKKIDEIYKPFLLGDTEISGYEVKHFGGEKFYTNHWSISNSQIKKTIVKEWNSPGNKTEFVRIEVGVYDSEAQALNGMVYHLRRGIATPFNWGSFSGSIIGDGSWTYVNQAIAFVRGNIGVKITTNLLKETDYQTIEEIIQKVLQKIENNLSPNITAKIQELMHTQIPKAKYDLLLVNIVNCEMKGALILNQCTSKWISGTEEFKLGRIMSFEKAPILLRKNVQYIQSSHEIDYFELGRRTEWKTEQGVLIGIDICQFTSKKLAENGAKKRAFETDAYFLDNPLYPKIPSIRWWMTTASIVFVKNKTAVHIYQFNKHNNAEVNLDFFAKATKKIASAFEP